MAALSDRKTNRNISEEKLSPQMLSNVLWAAWGVNRPASRGGRGVSDTGVQMAGSNAHAGFIAQNVYLFAASEGLASWFRALVDAPELSRLLSLRPSEKVSYSQGVGYPAKA